MSRRNKEENAAPKTIKVIRAKEYKETIFIDININGVTIYGCRYVEGKNGDFISFPSYKGKDDKYYSHAYAELTDEDVKEIDAQIDELLK